MALTGFSNPTPITITSPAPGAGPMPASPYPSNITVSGLVGLVTDVDVTIAGLTHGVANDLDIMLVAPGGQRLILMSDPGGTSALTSASGATITFDDSAASGLPASGSINGSYRPTDNDAGETSADSFPAPAPAPGSATTLAAAFTGIDPNGTWSLYIVDDTDGDNGTVSGGWSLSITDEPTAVATTTTLTASPNPSTTGAAVQFVATVTSAGAPVTSGTVTFSQGGTTLASGVALNASGQATFSTSALPEGSHLITVTYSGSSGLLTSNGSLTQTVDNPTTTPATGTWCNTGAITVGTSGPATPYPSRITVSGTTGLATLVTVNLAGVSHAVPVDLDVLLVGPGGQNLVLMSDVGGLGAVTGADLSFADAAAGSIPAGGPLVSGTYRPSDDDTDPDGPFPAPAPAPSAATTLATFNGVDPDGVWQLYVLDDASGDAGSIGGGWCLNVSTAVPTTTSLTSAPNPSDVGQSATFTATVTSGGGPVTAGSVTLRDGATVLASGLTPDSSGQVTFSTSALTEGSHPIVASYEGTSAFQSSTSSTLTHVVQKAATATDLTSSANPSTFGQSVTFTARVTSGGSPVTIGSVRFSIDGGTAVVVALDASGDATLTTSTLAVGTHPVVAAYGATTAFAASSDNLDQAVDLVATSTALTSSNNPSAVGEAVTFTATVTAGGSAVTAGTVTFTDGATDLAPPVPVDASGVATFTTSALSAGDHTIGAEYSGTPTLAASSDTTTQVVADAVAEAGGPYVIDEGEPLALDGASSTPPTGAEYSWDIDDDGVFGDATTISPTLTWAELVALGLDDGTGVATTVSLRVTNGPAVSTDSATLTIDNVAPTATLSNDGPVDEASTATVTFGSIVDPSDPDLAALEYRYDFDDDGTFELTSASPSATVPASFLDIGPSTVTVRAVVADDDGGSLELTTDIEVVNAPPRATIDGPSTAVVGVPVTIKVGAVDPSGDDMAGTFLFSVDWGDGSPLVTMPGPADPPVTHTYTASGTYVVVATASDPDGAVSAPLSFTIVVSAAPPPTTTAPTTTAPTTTDPGTTAPGTTAPGASTTTTDTAAGGSTTEAPTTTASGGVLARTGGGSTGTALAGLLLTAGVVLAIVGRRRLRGAA